jgi:hypothetical protein
MALSTAANLESSAARRATAGLATYLPTKNAAVAPRVAAIETTIEPDTGPNKNPAATVKTDAGIKNTVAMI